MTMNDTWGFKTSDTNWKSSTQLIRTMIDVASKGGNFLLNVGPTAEGEIPAASVERLEAMGAWLASHGGTIHGTHAGPFKRLTWGRCTARPWKEGVTLYLHVFDWPTDGVLRVPGLMNDVRAARLVGGFMSFGASRDRLHPEDVLIDVSSHTPEPGTPATVVAIDVVGEPRVTTPLIRARADGSLVLDATEAELNTRAARVEEIGGRHNIGAWTDEHDEVAWDAQTPPAGRYRVELEMSCEPGSDGDEYVVQVGPRTLRGVTKATAGWSDFVRISAGEAVIENPTEAASRTRIAVRPGGTLRRALMNLREVRLIPLEVK
jgi:alpha-L-fucosidase